MAEQVAGKPTVLGVAESIKKIAEIHIKQLEQLMRKAGENTVDFDKIKDAADIKIDPYFMRSITLYSNKLYTDLINAQKECEFYSYLDNDLLITAFGRITNIPINYQIKSGESELALISKRDFLAYFYQKRCFTNKEYAALFSFDNLSKTLSTLNMEKPTNTKQCKDNVSNWRTNPYYPYMCQIPERIKQAELHQSSAKNNQNLEYTKTAEQDLFFASKYKKNVKPDQLYYLNALCFSSSADQFCKHFIDYSVWDAVVNE